jgi:D-glycero-D-manno-heptose 1,7-bisphosphate phosphatase
MTGRAVFLDRDGVVNRAIVRCGRPYAPRSLEDLEILPGVHDSIAALKQRGYLIFIVTNQPDVSRGHIQRRIVDDMHGRLERELPIDGILACFHDDDDGCECRKPRAGLLLQAAREFALDLSRSFMVGDRWRDIEAGKRAGCATLFVDRAYDEEPPAGYDHRVGSLAEACALILAQRGPA